MIFQTHLNPIYYKVGASGSIEILGKEKEVFLKHDDQFGFLPDKCWFRISIRKTDNVEAASLILRVRQVAELNDSQNFAEIIPQVSNNHQEQVEEEISTSDGNLIVLPTPDFNFHDVMPPVEPSNGQELPQPSVVVKREAEEVSSGSPKRQRTENPTSSTTSEAPPNPCQSSENVSCHNIFLSKTLLRR